MKKYRVWLRDISLQSMVVDALDAKRAKEAAQALANGIEDTAKFEDFEQSSWEVTSIDQIIDPQ